jgi:hypothetical protein
MDEYEKAFQSITSVVLGRKLTGYRDYKGWLTRRLPVIGETRSAMSGKKVYLPFEFYEVIRHRLLTLEEAYGTAGKLHLSEEQVRGLSFANATEALKDISITTADTVMGNNSRVSECAVYYDSSVCFGSVAVATSRYAIYSFWPRQSEYVAGCHVAFSCSFCVRCFNSENLSRCLEVSDSASCTDCYFCYNCENLQDCMFCFNTKTKRYAIGNVQFPPEQYRKIKRALLAQMADELERNKELKWDIYNIGCAK